jgi:hypothetical protein
MQQNPEARNKREAEPELEKRNGLVLMTIKLFFSFPPNFTKNKLERLLVVEQSLHHPKVEGMSPAASAGTGRENVKKYSQASLIFKNKAWAYPKPWDDKASVLPLFNTPAYFTGGLVAKKKVLKLCLQDSFTSFYLPKGFKVEQGPML